MEKRILVYTNHYDPEYFKINDVVQWIFEKGAVISVITGNPNYPSGKLFKGFSFLGSIEIAKKGLTIYRLPLIPRGNGTKFRIVLNYLTYFLSTITFTLWCLFFHKKYDTVFVHHTSPPLLFLPALFYKKIRKSKGILWDLDMWPQTLEAMGILKSKKGISLLEIVFKQFYSTLIQIFAWLDTMNMRKVISQECCCNTFVSTSFNPLCVWDSIIKKYFLLNKLW